MQLTWGREFQNACIRHFEGEEVDCPITLGVRAVEIVLTYKLDQIENLEVLGKVTLQAVDLPHGQTGKHRRSSSASLVRMPVDMNSALGDSGSAALTDDPVSVSILKLPLGKHNDSKYIYNKCLVNCKRALGNSNLRNNNSSSKKSLSN